jgi:hypothetical protein
VEELGDQMETLGQAVAEWAGDHLGVHQAAFREVYRQGDLVAEPDAQMAAD